MTNAPESDRVRAELIDAASSGDRQRLADLCTTHRDLIRQAFPGWTQVPVEMRSDPALIQGYGGTLFKVASFFEQQLGDPSLLEAMTGPRESNPVVTWQQTLGEAKELMGRLRYAEARQALSHAVAEARGLQGSAVDSLLPVTFGMLGECYFQLGEAATALDPTATALRLCEEQGDLAGILAYQGNLFEIHRYLGQAEPAALAAERCADALTAAGQADQAAAWRRQARVARVGEPLNRVVLMVEGAGEREVDELDELQSVAGQRVNFIFKRNRLTLEPSRHRTGEGERLGGEGRHAEAHEAFQEAARLDPFDPHPRYLSGLTLLHLGRYAEAVSEYEATERLAPGWFHCRADLWLARELARGTLDPRLFQLLSQLEDAPIPPQEKVRMAEAALRAAPGLAPLHLFHGQNLQALGNTEAAATAYRHGLGCAAEPDIRTRLLVALGMVSPSAPERTAALTEATTTAGGNLVSTAMAKIALRTER